MTAAPPAPTAVRAELFGPGRLGTTIGLLLLISLVGFESMGVGTAMPALVADLGAVSLYAWPFVAFMAAAVFGTVLGGRWCDRAGPRAALVVAPLLFGVGLVVAGTAVSMPQLLVGRVLQGLGSGTQAVAVYVLVAAVYAERARPAVFGLISSAWVLPSLLGPPVAGVLTETLSWHWVFLGLVPFVLVAVALVVPAVRRMAPPDPRREIAPAGRGLVAAALGASAGVAALSWASQRKDAVAVVVAAVSRRGARPRAGAAVPARGVPGRPRHPYRRGRPRVARRGVLHRQLVPAADAQRDPRLVARDWRASR